VRDADQSSPEGEEATSDAAGSARGEFEEWASVSFAQYFA
jgi:hypothetical protein